MAAVDDNWDSSVFRMRLLDALFAHIQSGKPAVEFKPEAYGCNEMYLGQTQHPDYTVSVRLAGLLEMLDGKHGPRFCVVSDDDGHRWICPVERKEEVEKSLAELGEYWGGGDCSKGPPDDLTVSLPRWEGQDLTFTDPRLV